MGRHFGRVQLTALKKQKLQQPGSGFNWWSRACWASHPEEQLTAWAGKAAAVKFWLLVELGVAPCSTAQSVSWVLWTQYNASLVVLSSSGNKLHMLLSINQGVCTLLIDV